MSNNFADRLTAAIEKKKSPICVGIDPIFDMLPDAVAGDPSKRNANDREAAIDATFDFTIAVLRLVAPHVPVVKFQSAYFEQFLWEGVEAYYSLIAEAAELGLLVIGDVKRGDIGSTASAYAAGHLADPAFAEQEDVVTPDAITVNPFCGLDTIEPFVKTARAFDKGLFVLVRTSNSGSADLQDTKLADGRTWSEMLADRLQPIAQGEGLVGSSSFSSIGAVVGATQPQTMQSLRQRLPNSYFLLPGYGAQGATAEMTRSAFINGRGALVSASRSILYAHREKKYADQYGDDWEACVEQAVLEMKADVGRVLSA
ncbi:MAG TPA: orotidine-5'-phosphate decarboxylase [Humisphaera sp.]|jgi:orotidine-5'-phosphate decarboxylase|nr:orotidine-5'-phosphate decarboxylase [Humisphaera sp.]